MCDNLEKIITNLMAPVKRIIIAGKRSHDEIFAGVGAGGGRGGAEAEGAEEGVILHVVSRKDLLVFDSRP